MAAFTSIKLDDGQWANHRHGLSRGLQKFPFACIVVRIWSTSAF